MPIKTLPNELRILSERFIRNEVLTLEEDRKIILIKRFLLPFIPVYSSNDAQEKSLLTRSLYIQIPELLSEYSEKEREKRLKIIISDVLYDKSCNLIMLSKLDEALDTLEMSVTYGKQNKIKAKKSKFFEKLNNNPRFQSLIS